MPSSQTKRPKTPKEAERKQKTRSSEHAGGFSALQAIGLLLLVGFLGLTLNVWRISRVLVNHGGFHRGQWRLGHSAPPPRAREPVDDELYDDEPTGTGMGEFLGSGHRHRGEKEEAPAKPTKEPAPVPQVGGCAWVEHKGEYLGNCVGGGCGLYPLEEAMATCLEHRQECRGVTCEEPPSDGRLADKCSLRIGEPYLEFSAAGEVSYTTACGPAPPQQSQPEAEAPVQEVEGGAPIVEAAPDASLVGKPLSRQPLQPGRLILVIIAHNNPTELRDCLAAFSKLKGIEDIHIAVSLDDPPKFNEMERVARAHGGKMKVDVWRKISQGSRKSPVAKISDHFKFAIGGAFDNRGFEYAIFLENDLRPAPDFLWYFRATAWLLEEDPTLFCVSAWNDNGVSGLIEEDQRRLFRTDYFPGLGWMIHRDTWKLIKDRWPRMPSTGWDHWLRHGSGLQKRECIAPEVPRTHHADVQKGTTVTRGSKASKRLQSMALSNLAPQQLGDLKYLLIYRYEKSLKMSLRTAERTSLSVVDDGLKSGGLYMLPYVREEYAEISNKFKLFPAQPRTSHRGVISFRKDGATIVLVDRRVGADYLPAEDVWKPHAERTIDKARPGQSCEDHCSESGLRCDARELEFINSCEFLTREFACEEGCGHQVGQELPAYVHDAKRDTGKQCLMSDDSLSKCDAKCPATTRLCVCVP